MPLVDWTKQLHGAVLAAPTIEEGVMKLIQIVHNEIVHGNGTVSPVGKKLRSIWALVNCTGQRVTG